MRFKVANYSRLEIRLDTLHIYSFTDLIFVDPGVKVNGSYYLDVLLSQKLLPVMREMSGEFFYLSAGQRTRTETAILSDFWRRQRQRPFPQICSLRTAPT